MSLPNTSREFATKETLPLIVPLTHVRPVLREGILQARLVKQVFETMTCTTLMIFPFFFSFFLFFISRKKREIRCMDLGMTALGNWKAQQGGCTHIQVRSPTPILDRNRRVSQGGRIPLFPPSSLPPFFWPNLQFFNEINDLKYVSFSYPPLPGPN
jgi:hypothetical protein